MVQQVREHIDQVYKQLIQQISRSEAQKINGLVKKLLDTTKMYSMAAANGLNAFKTHKVRTHHLRPL